MGKVFISYRHSDSTPGWATAIQVYLKSICGLDAFKDVDSLTPGVDWPKHIRQALDGCDHALVLIGASWLNATDEHGQRRLDDPDDFVRFEIAEVLHRDTVTVVPVLFDAISMPPRGQLPENIRALADRQAYKWHSDQPSDVHLRRLQEVVALIGTDVPSGMAGLLSAQVLAMSSAAFGRIADPDARREMKEIQRSLGEPLRDTRGVRGVIGDAERADRALERLERLGARSPGLSFLRDRVEEVRDSGPETALIEVAKWFARCLNGELDLSHRRLDELQKLLLGGSPTERLGLDASATDRDIREVALARASEWVSFENSSDASPSAQRLARAVQAFYERQYDRTQSNPGLSIGAANA